MEFKSKSSSIDSVKYDKDKNVLEVTFKNGITYQYHKVTEVDFQFFKAAKSHGKFLMSNIAGKFKANVKPKKKSK